MSSKLFNRMKRNYSNVGQCQLELLWEVFRSRGYVLDDNFVRWFEEQTRVGVPFTRLVNTIETGKRPYNGLEKTTPRPHFPVTALFKKIRGKLRHLAAFQVYRIRTLNSLITPPKEKAAYSGRIGGNLWYVANSAEEAAERPAMLGVYNEYRSLFYLASTMSNGPSAATIATLTHYCGQEMVMKVRALSRSSTDTWHTKAHLQAQLEALGEVHALLLKANRSLSL